MLSAWLYATCWARRNKALRCDRDTPCSQGPSTDKKSFKLKTKLQYIPSKNNKCTCHHRRNFIAQWTATCFVPLVWPSSVWLGQEYKYNWNASEWIHSFKKPRIFKITFVFLFSLLLRWQNECPKHFDDHDKIKLHSYNQSLSVGILILFMSLINWQNMEPTQNQKLPLFSNDFLENFLIIPTCFEKQINFWKRETWENTSEKKAACFHYKEKYVNFVQQNFEYLLQAK